MRQTLVVVLGLLFLAGACAGDVVYLKDGRKLEGTVTTTADTVTVQTKFGPATFPRSAVDRIEKKASSEEIYAEKAKAVAVDDAKGHYELGLWCKENGLSREAKAEFEKVIAIAPEHAEARAELGYVKIDGKWEQAPPGKIYAGDGEWLTPAEGLENAQARYKLEQYEAAQKLLEASMTMGLPADQRLDAQILLGQICERQGKWGEACASYDKVLRMKVTPEQKAQLECRKQIISESKGGMYLINEVAGKEDIFSIDAKDPKTPKEALKGLQPLTNPVVMEQAIRDKASARVLKGKDLLGEAKKAMDGTDEGRKAGVTLLNKAEVEFAAANLLVKGIARGFQVEGAKQRFGGVEKQLQLQINAFNGQMQAAMMQETKTQLKARLPAAYQTLMAMERSLDELNEIARGFPEEMADEVARIQALRNEVMTIKTYIENLAKGL